MGFFSSTFAKVGAVLNPVTLLANAAALGPDMYMSEQQRKAARDASDAANLTNREISAREAELQREFAKNGIRWRVEDATAAGLHPLAALGASGASYSPTSAFVSPDYSKADHWGRMGQSLSRAMNVAMTAPEREFQRLQLANASLQNDLLSEQVKASKLANINAAGGNPALPSNSGMPALTGQGNWRGTGGNAYVNEKPLERIHSQPGRPAQEVGAVPDYAFSRTNKGLAIVPSKDVKEKIEDQLVPEIMWAMRNQLAPNFGKFPKPDPKYYPLPKGFSSWEWNHWRQEFRPWKSQWSNVKVFNSDPDRKFYGW